MRETYVIFLTFYQREIYKNFKTVRRDSLALKIGNVGIKRNSMRMVARILLKSENSSTIWKRAKELLRLEIISGASLEIIRGAT